MSFRIPHSRFCSLIVKFCIISYNPSSANYKQNHTKPQGNRHITPHITVQAHSKAPASSCVGMFFFLRTRIWFPSNGETHRDPNPSQSFLTPLSALYARIRGIQSGKLNELSGNCVGFNMKHANILFRIYNFEQHTQLSTVNTAHQWVRTYFNDEKSTFQYNPTHTIILQPSVGKYATST